MSFYRISNAISAQVQVTGVWLQVGGNIVGWHAKSWLTNRRPGPPLLVGLKLWAPIHGCGMRHTVGIYVGRARLVYTTGSEVAPGHYLEGETGWRFSVRRMRIR